MNIRCVYCAKKCVRKLTVREEKEEKDEKKERMKGKKKNEKKYQRIDNYRREPSEKKER